MKKYILLIDDDADEIDFFSEALKTLKKPLVCVQTKSAKDAMQLLTYVLPDYIFLDINMPEVDGLECLEQIKSIRHFRDVPVILYSNGINDAIADKALESGAAACVKKSCQVSVLADTLETIFS